jgi:hypothetical protein
VQRARPGEAITRGAEDSVPHFAWEGKPSRRRLSWQTSLRWPGALVYEHLDPSARYLVRLHVMTDKAAGRVALRIDGESASPRSKAERIGDVLEYAVPADALSDGRLELTFDPVDERALNWRQYSRLVEAWLIRQPPSLPASSQAIGR